MADEQCASAKTLENYEAVWKTVPEKATCFQDFNYAYDDHGVLRNTINGDKVLAPFFVCFFVSSSPLVIGSWADVSVCGRGQCSFTGSTKCTTTRSATLSWSISRWRSPTTISSTSHTHHRTRTRTRTAARAHTQLLVEY